MDASEPDFKSNMYNKLLYFMTADFGYYYGSIVFDFAVYTDLLSDKIKGCTMRIKEITYNRSNGYYERDLTPLKPRIAEAKR